MEELIVAALCERDATQTPLRARLISAQYAAAQKVLEAELAGYVPERLSDVQAARANTALEKPVDEVFEVLQHGLSR